MKTVKIGTQTQRFMLQLLAHVSKAGDVSDFFQYMFAVSEKCSEKVLKTMETNPRITRGNKNFTEKSKHQVWHTCQQTI